MPGNTGYFEATSRPGTSAYADQSEAFQLPQNHIDTR
jgi:hypothetical protein